MSWICLTRWVHAHTPTRAVRLTRVPSADRSAPLIAPRQYVSEVGILSTLVELEDLNLSFNDLTSISELGGAAQLERLLVMHNKLRSLDGVDKMRRLRTLHAHKNRVADLGALSECTHLEELWVQQNSIRDIEVFVRCLAELPGLKRLVAFPNPFCPYTEGDQYQLCRRYLLTKLRSLTYLNGDLGEHERPEADEYFHSPDGRRQLKALVPAEPAKKSRSRAQPIGPPDVHEGSYHLSLETRLQREHSSVLKALRRVMAAPGQRTLNGRVVSDAKSMFEAMDRDGSGMVDGDEFTRGMKRLGLGLNEQQVVALAHALDKDGDGEIDYSELLAFLYGGGTSRAGRDGYDEAGFERRRGQWARTGSGNSSGASPTTTAAVAPATRLNRKGVSGSHFHQALPKDALLKWLNEMLELHETLDTLVSAAAICQVMDVLGRCCPRFPDCVPMQKVNFRAVVEHDCVKNYKVLQEVFRRFGIEEQPNWSTLAQGRSTDLLELLRWTHRFCEEHGITGSEWKPFDRGDGQASGGQWEHQYALQQRDGTEYNPVRRREKALKQPARATAKKPSQKFTSHVAKRSGAFVQTERSALGLHAASDPRQAAGSPRQRRRAASPAWGETRAETQARAFSGIKSDATSPRSRSRTADHVQRHASPSRPLRSPSTGASRSYRSRSSMENSMPAGTLRMEPEPQPEERDRISGADRTGSAEVELESAQRMLRKIQQLCDNARGSSPGRDDGGDLEEFITSVERVLAASPGGFANRQRQRQPSQEVQAMSPAAREDRDELALLRAQIEAMDAKISQRDAASPVASVASATDTSSVTPAPGPSLSPRTAHQSPKAHTGLGLHVPSTSQMDELFAAHQGGATEGLLSWDDAQRASDDLYPVRS